jgi:aldehyde dehydrogenase (NAD+)
MSIAEKFVAMQYGPAPEDPTEVLAWLDHHGRRFGHFIDGAWRQPAEAGYFETADPSTS